MNSSVKHVLGNGEKFYTPRFKGRHVMRVYRTATDATRRSLAVKARYESLIAAGLALARATENA